MNKEVLASIRREAYKEGDFTLGSGLKSSYYIDCKAIILKPKEGCGIAQMMLETIEKNSIEIEAVGGMALAAIPISTAIMVLSHIEKKPIVSFFVRKDAKGHGLKKKLEGTLEKGMRVVVVDDVITTGQSSIEAVDAVIAQGGTVEAVVSIVDREMGGKEAFAERNIPYYPLFTISEIRGNNEGV